MTENNYGIITSLEDLLTSGFGFTHGFCDAQGFTLPKNYSHNALSYTGTAYMCIKHLISGGFICGSGACVLGVREVSNHYPEIESKEVDKAKHVLVKTGLGTIKGAAAGGTWGLAEGAVRTTIGYFLGYICGYMLK